MRAAVSWTVLGLLLAALLAAAATFDHRRWPMLVGDEAVYLMQAQSLAWDLDLAYSADDLRRFEEQWGRLPEGVILQSSDGGRSIAYGKPVFYSLALAPFLRLAPIRGAPVANTLFLALAALAAAWALRRPLGAAAPLWVAAYVFASVTFAHVFWVHADLFLFCLVTGALALAYGGVAGPGEPGTEPLPEVWGDAQSESSRWFWLRWGACGVFLAMVAAARPFYATLLLPAALAVPPRRRRAGLLALGAGAAVLLLAWVGTNLAVRGTWTSYGGERQGFYSHTGFPGDGEAGSGSAQWQETVPGVGASWIGPGKLDFDLDLRQSAYNALYFVAGRHVGVLPYFLPLLLGLVAFRARRGRWALLAAAAVSMALFFYVRPFNIYGGGGSLANRYFLPVYPVFLFAAAAPLKGALARRAWVGPVVVAVAAAPFLWPLWTAPRAFPFGDRGGPAYVSDVARRVLPYETTQSNLKPSGSEDVRIEELWIKPLTPGLKSVPGRGELALGPERRASLLVGTPKPLETLVLGFSAPGPGRLEVDGGSLGETAFGADGTSAFEVHLDKTWIRHRMWWGGGDVYLYPVSFRVPESSLEGSSGGGLGPTEPAGGWRVTAASGRPKGSIPGQ